MFLKLCILAITFIMHHISHKHLSSHALIYPGSCASKLLLKKATVKLDEEKQCVYTDKELGLGLEE